MTLNLAFFNNPAMNAAIQDGILERAFHEQARPTLFWRGLGMQEQHQGRQGERVIKTKPGLFIPVNARTGALLTAGVDPTLINRTLEQYQYQISGYGLSHDVNLPASYLAQANVFVSDAAGFMFLAQQQLGRLAREVVFDAYEGGDTFATTGATSTALVVAECRGWAEVLVNGVPTPVSSTNPITATLSGSTAVNVTASSATSGPGTLTLSSSQTWSTYDRIIRTDAAVQVRQSSRTTDRLIVSGDTPTFATFRRAATILATNNVPGIQGPGTPYLCLIDPYTKEALFADAELTAAKAAIGITGIFAEGSLGQYANIIFREVAHTELPTIASASPFQTDIHRSVMLGAESFVEEFIPEPEFAGEIPYAGIATANHYKTVIDGDPALTFIVRAPLDALGRMPRLSWVANVGYAVPSDLNNLTGASRFKRAVIIKTAGPAFSGS